MNSLPYLCTAESNSCNTILFDKKRMKNLCWYVKGYIVKIDNVKDCQIVFKINFFVGKNLRISQISATKYGLI